MDNKERELFWKTLCSLQGDDMNSERERLRKTIKLPKYLYRYRSVNFRNLEALRTNKLYFSSATTMTILSIHSLTLILIRSKKSI